MSSAQSRKMLAKLWTLTLSLVSASLIPHRISFGGPSSPLSSPRLPPTPSFIICRYCDAVAEIAESYGGGAIRPLGGQDIYTETIAIDEPSFLNPTSDNDATFCLISAVLFTKLLPTLTGRLDMILKGYEMSSTTSGFLRDR
jgi:hypothetical protein